MGITSFIIKKNTKLKPQELFSTVVFVELLDSYLAFEFFCSCDCYNSCSCNGSMWSTILFTRLIHDYQTKARRFCKTENGTNKQLASWLLSLIKSWHLPPTTTPEGVKCLHLKPDNWQAFRPKKRILIRALLEKSSLERSANYDSTSYGNKDSSGVTCWQMQVLGLDWSRSRSVKNKLLLKKIK